MKECARRLLNYVQQIHGYRSRRAVVEIVQCKEDHVRKFDSTGRMAKQMLHVIAAGVKDRRYTGYLVIADQNFE